MTQLKYAFRSLFKSPGFTAVAILTIAIGIAANTALFSAFSTLVLHPIALPDAGRLVRVWTNNKQRNVVAPVMSVPKYRMFVEQNTAFSSIAASGFNTAVLTRDGADPEQLTALNATASFVPTTGMLLARGRDFTPEEDVKNGPNVCLITYDLWQSHFGLREDVLNSTIQLNGVGTTVVGILADPIPAPITGVQVLLPQALTPAFLTEQQIEGGAGFLQVTARLKPGTSFAQAAADVRAISKRYEQESPGRLDANNENELRTWIEEAVGPVRPTFLLLLTAVGFVLLIACANVSNLFLSRLAGRHKEIAVRLSLGATRGHLIQQFLLETVIFCVLAATLGVVLAAWSLSGIERALLAQLATRTHFSLDPATLAFTVGLSVLSSVVIGLIPAVQASNVNLSDVLKDSARGTVGGAKGTRLRGILIVTEVALSSVLLVGSGLLLWSFIKLQATPPGFSPKGVASVFVNPPAQSYPTRVEQVNFYYRILDQLKGNASVRAAAVTQGLPLNGGIRGVYAVGGRPAPPLAERPIAFINIGTEGYFDMLQIPLKSGRVFQSTDIDGAPLVCVINESFAKRLFQNENPVGQFLLRGQNADIKMQIVGVVGDVKSSGLNTPPPETMYMPLRQIGGGAGLNVVASVAGDPSALQPVLRAAVSAVDKSEAVSAFATMDTQLQQSLGVQRVTAWLTGAFAGVALLLSALGLYSVLAYAVSQRRGEIGIRMALGAARGDVIRLIVLQGMKLVVIGLAVGLGVAAAGGRVLASLLYGVTPLNPLVFGGVAGLFAVVAALACLLPSWRASRIDALVALRSD